MVRKNSSDNLSSNTLLLHTKTKNIMCIGNVFEDLPDTVVDAKD